MAKYTAHLEEDKEKTSPLALLRGLSPRLFIKKIHNLSLLIRHGDLYKPVAKSVCPMRYLNTFATPFKTLTFSSNSLIMKALFKHYRNDPKGLFVDRENQKIFLAIIKDIYPEDHLTADDFLLSCRKQFVSNYRQPILSFIGPQSIKTHSDQLEDVVKNTIDIWTEASQKGKVNATKFVQVFTTSVISQLILGHPGPFEIYQEISEAIDFLNNYAMKKASHIPISKEEKQTYKRSLDAMRSAIEYSLENRGGSLIGSLSDALSDMPVPQIRTTLFLMYFGGSETTTSLLTYLLWQLGRHPEYQKEIREEIKQKEEDLSLYDLAHSLDTVDKLFNEALRLHTPAYIIGRQPAKNLVCTVKDEKGDSVFREKIPKKHVFLAGSAFAARDPSKYDKPDEFNPHRFKERLKTLPWLPFAEGRHFCPGQWLAKAEVLLLVTLLVKKFHITSYPEKEIHQRGDLTLKVEEEIHLSLDLIE